MKMTILFFLGFIISGCNNDDLSSSEPISLDSNQSSRPVKNDSILYIKERMNVLDSTSINISIIELRKIGFEIEGLELTNQLVLKKRIVSKFNFETSVPENETFIDTTRVHHIVYYGENEKILRVKRINSNNADDTIIFDYSWLGGNCFIFPTCSFSNNNGLIYIHEGFSPIFIGLASPFGLADIKCIIKLDSDLYPMKAISDINAVNKELFTLKQFEEDFHTGEYSAKIKTYHYKMGNPHYLENKVIVDSLKFNYDINLKEVFDIMNKKNYGTGEKRYLSMNPQYYLYPIWLRFPYHEFSEEGHLKHP